MDSKVFEQVQPQKFYMQIAREIKNSIRDGKLKVGDKLPSERILAEQFGASRASIREAMSALEMLGLIVCRSGQGNFVKADASEGSINSELLRALLQGHDPYEIFETRLEIEPRLAGLAAERAKPGEIAELRGIIARIESIGNKSLEEDDRNDDEYLEEDRKLHLMIGRCSHNSVLITVFSAVNAMMKETHWVALYKGALRNPTVLKGNLKFHERILDAIEQHDAERAREEMTASLKTLQTEIFGAG